MSKDNVLGKASVDINNERNNSDNNKSQTKLNKIHNSQINQNSNVYYNLKLNKNEKFEYIDQLRNELVDLEDEFEAELLNYLKCKECTEAKNKIIQQKNNDISEAHQYLIKQLSSGNNIIQDPTLFINQCKADITLLEKGLFFNNTKCTICSYKKRATLNRKIKHTKKILNRIIGG